MSRTVKSRLFVHSRHALIVMCIFTLFAVLFGCKSKHDKNGMNPSPSNIDTVFKEPTEISIIIGSHTSWPYNPDWKMWSYFQEALGATLHVEALSNYDLDQRISLMVASREKMPDLIHVISKAAINQHASTGAFVNINNNMDKLPNFKSFLNTLDPQVAQELMQRNTSIGSNIFIFPNYGLDTMNNLRTWMYRKDIFEKNGLSIPASMDELYNDCKILKQKYPDSYPLCIRSWKDTLNVIAPQWKPYLQSFVYYDFNSSKWRLGATEDAMKEIVVYFNKLYREKLIPPDFMTINVNSWEQLVNSDRGFIMPEYILRIDYFNAPNRLNNPKYTWAFMPPPGTSKVQNPKLSKTNWEFSGYVVCNTGDQKRIDNAFKMVDWMYSPNGIELLSWGKAGETYDIDNGKRKFILDDRGTTPRNLYGVGTYGLYQVIDPSSNESLYSDENVEQGRKAIKYIEDKINPAQWVPLNVTEKSVEEQNFNSLNQYCNTELIKFITGELPITDWDTFQKGIKDRGSERLLSAYETAYKRIRS